ncbi:enkurin [Anastrepha obliqua]|uniref:enkurin n=1 Tax=Anastrepha ludens TaxID=28586 RepID=UPI0023B1A0CF|nr:enkurin [Anastrepha ludens]XP_054733504.1 enkurin [Anastrepha obliqua]
MSLVYITRHNENINDLENKSDYYQLLHSSFTSRPKASKKKKIDAVIKLPDGKQLLTGSQKSEHKTMGYSETPLREPCEFLRKNGGVKWQRKRDHTCPKRDEPILPVPRLEDLKKEKRDKEKKKVNFIKKNANCIKGAPAKWHPPQYIDFHTGTPRRLENSGLVPKYVCSGDFGKVPCYLRVRKRALRPTLEKCKSEQIQLAERCKFNEVNIRQLPSEERDNILKGLKQHFNNVFKAYQSGSLYTDTISKRLRKSNLEKELRQLEHDIFLLESNPVIYVSEF